MFNRAVAILLAVIAIVASGFLRAAEVRTGPNVILTNEGSGVGIDGTFGRVELPQSRSATVLKGVGSGPHQVRFDADLGLRGYYRVSLWWPQAAGAADIVVHSLQGMQRVHVEPGLRSGEWITGGVFALPESHAQVEVVGAAGPLFVDALRLQYVGEAPPPPSFAVDELPIAIVGMPYVARINVIDGVPPLVFSVDAAELPAGMSFDDQSGTFHGVPETPGTYKFNVEVYDQGSHRTLRQFALHIVAASRADNAEPPHTKSFKVDAPVAKDGVAAGTPPNLSGLVSLLATLPEGEWTQASLNTYSSVWTPADLRPLDNLSNPPPDRIILAWSGFTWDPNRGDLLLYGGGHANYSGNDVYRWRGTTRQWERASLPSEIKQDDLGNWQAVDGWDAAPTAAHTYDTTSFFPHIDRMVVFGGAAYNSGDSFMRELTPTTKRLTGPFFFDPAKADPNKVGGTTGSHVKRVAPHPEIVGGQMWSNRDIYVNIPNQPILAGAFLNSCAAYAEEDGQDVAYLGARPAGGGTSLNLYRYSVAQIGSPSLDTSKLVGIFWNGPADQTACGYDPMRRLFVRTGIASMPFVYWDLTRASIDNRDVPVTPVDPTGEFPTLLANGGVYLPNCGFDFDAKRNRFALWCGDGRVWMLTPPATATPTGWTIVRQKTPALAQPNGDVGTGILGKWKYISNLDAFIGLQDRTLGNIWIYKPVGWVNPQLPVSTAPPSSVNASDGTSTANVAVTWKSSAGAVSYSVYRSTSAGVQGSLIGSSTGVSFLDTSATPGVTYFYGVTATGAAGTSPLSAQDSGFRLTTSGGGVNVALAANGGVASASSTNGPGYLPATVIDNKRAGAGWGNGGGWNDATFGTFPDWLQINFAGVRTIDRVVVYSVQDNYTSPIESTDTTTFTLRGITDFTVQGFNGTNWIMLASVTGNQLVKRSVAFAPFATDRIRINITNANGNGWSRLTEVEAWSSSTNLSGESNFALASNGGVASASSTNGPGFASSTLIDNQRSGSPWGAGGGWNDATLGTFPDWIQVNFNGTRTIDRVVVYSVQDNYLAPVEPTDTMTFSLRGISTFTVQGFNGSTWITLAVVSGNRLVKRSVTFTPFSTDRIRVNIYSALGNNWSRVTEVEAWGI